MKVLLYLFLFVAIMGIGIFGFFTMQMPDIPQTMTTKTLDPKDAFARAPDAEAARVSESPAVAPAAP